MDMIACTVAGDDHGRAGRNTMIILSCRLDVSPSKIHTQKPAAYDTPERRANADLPVGRVVVFGEC